MMISVCVITYNHEQYIHQTIEGILGQKCKYDLEIVIGEDCSTDNTYKICKRYQNQYPGIIRIIKRDRNSGMSANFLKTLRACSGKYIAICEGDDYWIHPNKLEIQIDYLEKNLPAGGCFHDVKNVDENGIVIKDNYFSPTKYVYNQFDCLTILRSSYSTCSLVFRKKVIGENLPDWFIKRSCDEFLDLLITQNGKELHYIPKNMAVYRIHNGGIWQGQSNIGRNKDKWYRAKLLLEDRVLRSKYLHVLTERFNKISLQFMYEKNISFLEYIKYLYFYNTLGGIRREKIINTLKNIYHFIAKRYFNFISKTLKSKKF